MASAISDVMASAIGPDRVNGMCDAIVKCSEQELRAGDGIEKRLREYLGVTEAKTVSAMFNGPDTVNLPAGASVYRLSNAVSFFAQSSGITPDRRIELQEYAGQLLGVKAKPAKEV